MTRPPANIRKQFGAALCAGLLLPAALQAQTSPNPPLSGREFQSRETRAVEEDEFAHPGLLWVEQGKRLAGEARPSGGKRCTDCHGEADGQRSLRGVAAQYPKWNPTLRRVLNLEQQINQCVSNRQQSSPLAWESRELLSLTVWVASQSKGLPIRVQSDGEAQATLERGKALYNQRIGQMNLACTHCHDRHWGKTLLAESISQGQPDGWPAYRLEWQSLASLQRRLRACFHGVRAEQPAFGSEDLVALELYLAKRAEGLRLSAPGVRR